MRRTWAEFYQQWGKLMWAFAEVFVEWAQRSQARSIKLWSDEIRELTVGVDPASCGMEVWLYGVPRVGTFKNGALEDPEPGDPPWMAIEFDDKVDTDGKAWPAKYSLSIEPEATLGEAVTWSTEGEHVPDTDDGVVESEGQEDGQETT